MSELEIWQLLVLGLLARIAYHLGKAREFLRVIAANAEPDDDDER